VNRGNPPPKPPITSINLLKEPETAYLRGKLVRLLADHEENAADHLPRKMVIGKIQAVIGRQLIRKTA
jgi:hypothetical protein